MAKRPRGPQEIKLDSKAERIAVPPALPMSDIMGHAVPKRVLNDAMASGRVHHCWIFQGPQGVGKFTSAVAFAALLLDPTTARDFSGAFAADPDSVVQRLLRSGSHPDLHVIVKELARFSADKTIRDSKQKNIPMAVAEEFLLDPASRAANLHGGAFASKVFLVDEAELLARGGDRTQGVLLKMLEEPPAGTVFILCTTAEDLLLPTIRSRSQRVSFALLSDREMQRWVASRTQLPAGPEADWLVSFAAGSPGVLEAAQTGRLYTWWERLAPMLRALDAGEFRPELAGAMWECADGWATAWVEKHPHSSKESANRDGADWIFRLLAWWNRPSLFTKPLLAAGRIDAIRGAERRLDANVNGLFVMEELAGRLSGAAALV